MVAVATTVEGSRGDGDVAAIGSPVRLTEEGIDGRLSRRRGFRPEDGVAARVGGNLTRWRERRGMTQVTLARKVGRDASTVCRWEAGERMPTVPALLVLARALGCDAAALLAGVAADEKEP